MSLLYGFGNDLRVIGTPVALACDKSALRPSVCTIPAQA
jgi:hypothetical protein